MHSIMIKIAIDGLLSLARSKYLYFRELADLDAHVFELSHEKLIVYSFSSHCKGYQVTDHVAIHAQAVLRSEVSNYFINSCERYEG